MAAVTRDLIRDAVIFRADLPPSEPRRVSDAQLDTLINRSMLRLQGVLQRFDSEDYFRVQAEATIPALSTGELYGEAAKIIHVMWKQSANSGRLDYLPLKLAQREDIAQRGATQETWRRAEPPRWYVSTDVTTGLRNLRFVPVPTEEEQILFVAQEEFTYEDDATPIVLDYAWEEWVVLDVTVALRQRDKQDANDLIGERTRTEIMIREQAPERFKDAGRQVTDRDYDFVSLRDPLDIP